jgi:hypothetical protein
MFSCLGDGVYEYLSMDNSKQFIIENPYEVFEHSMVIQL